MNIYCAACCMEEEDLVSELVLSPHTKDSDLWKNPKWWLAEWLCFFEVGDFARKSQMVYRCPNEEVILTQISRDVVRFYRFQIQEQVFCVLWIGVSFQHRCRCGWYATSAKLHLGLQQVLLLQLVIDVTTVSQEINHQYSTPNKSVLYLEVAQFQNDLLFIRVIILHCCIIF